MEHYCGGCHTKHVADSSFDGHCPACGDPLPDGTCQYVQEWLVTQMLRQDAEDIADI